MKFLITTALALALPLTALAQTAAPAAAAPKAAPKAAATQSGNDAAQQKKAPIRRSAAKAVEENTPIDTDTSIILSDEDLEIAKRVYVGSIPCELGASVTITANEKRPGFFTVAVNKGARFSMHPVGSRTGAIRLEDPRAGALWLQLGNKSMLMSQKLGQRLADECMSPAQVTYADELKKNPIPGILDTPKIVIK
ncbi:MAG: hypothetical protein LH479_02860 [Polaromonas sp.]|nr:hypothetical protein [Polaromonas sp.]